MLVCAICQNTPMDPDDPREQCEQCDPHQLNSNATLSPQREPFTRPSLTLAGVQVFAFIDAQGCLVVTIDLDDSQIQYGPELAADNALVPLTIELGDRELIPQRWPDHPACRCTYHTGNDGRVLLVHRDQYCEAHPPAPAAEADIDTASGTRR